MRIVLRNTKAEINPLVGRHGFFSKNNILTIYSTYTEIVKTRSPAVAEGPRDAGVPVEIL